MTDVATKSAAQIAHEQRNADAKAAAAQAKADRILAHRNRNFSVSVDALQRRDKRIEDHVERNADRSIGAAFLRARRIADQAVLAEEVAEAEAIQAFAEEMEARYGITANDNAAIAQAA